MPTLSLVPRTPMIITMDGLGTRLVHSLFCGLILLCWIYTDYVLCINTVCILL